MKRNLSIIALACLALLAAATLGSDESEYVADAVDSICGLDDPRKLSHPAVVDHSSLMDVTPFIRRLRRERIDPKSAEGIVLTTKAQGLVRQKCGEVMREAGHCSIWRRIRRRDGRPIPDVTALVRKRIEGHTETATAAVVSRRT